MVFTVEQNLGDVQIREEVILSTIRFDWITMMEVVIKDLKKAP